MGYLPAPVPAALAVSLDVQAVATAWAVFTEGQAGGPGKAATPAINVNGLTPARRELH